VNRSPARRTPTLRDRAIRFAEAATTPLLPADYLDLFTPLRSGADLRGRIVAVEPETRDAVTITIRPGRDWKGHRPGQYIRIGVDVNGVRQWRAYSLTSRTDRGDGCLTITTKAIPDGKVSNHLLRHARPGQLIHLDQAAGDFVLPDPAPSKLLFVTAGSGVTPVMGMLRNGVAGDVVVVHCAPSEPDSIFRDELQALADAGRIRLFARYDDVHGMLRTEDLPALVPDLAERTTYACGPVGLLDALEKQWADLGVPDRLLTERFRPVVVTAGEGGTVTFASGATIDADGSTPILDAAEEAGVLMPSGCRMGICFGCVLPMREGAVRDLRNGELTIATPGDGVVIQTCVSAAAGACHLDH
jgi:ferredoxin-NADP reductase